MGWGEKGEKGFRTTRMGGKGDFRCNRATQKKVSQSMRRLDWEGLGEIKTADSILDYDEGKRLILGSIQLLARKVDAGDKRK